MVDTYAMALEKLSDGRIGLFDSHAHDADGAFGSPGGFGAFMMFSSENAVSCFLKQNFRSTPC